MSRQVTHCPLFQHLCISHLHCLTFLNVHITGWAPSCNVTYNLYKFYTYDYLTLHLSNVQSFSVVIGNVLLLSTTAHNANCKHLNFTVYLLYKVHTHIYAFLQITKYLRQYQGYLCRKGAFPKICRLTLYKIIIRSYL